MTDGLTPPGHPHPAPSGAPAFDLSGGSLPLDFVNTWSDRGRPETDGLREYRDLVALVAQTGHLSETDADALRRRAERQKAAARRTLESGRLLRDALYRLFAARARGRELDAADLEPLNATLREALPHLRLVERDGGFDWTWTPSPRELSWPLWPIARGAAELLTGDALARVRECDGERCTWLFLDRSRTGARRWCSMESCGNRAKAKRHYARRKAT